MHLIVSDCSSELDCPVYVIMEDSEGNGWDGAKLNVRIDEGTPLTINMNSTEGKVKFQKIAASNGGFIDLEYDHGANNQEHIFYLLDVSGNILADENDNLVYFGENLKVNLILE